MARGTAIITATFQGQSDDAPFEVLAGITGNWAGTYEVQQCSGSSSSIYELMCMPPNLGREPGLAYVGATLPIAMALSENGNDVTGVVTLGNVRGTLTGTGSRTGSRFSLQGAIASAGTTLSITHWDTLVQRDEMQGFINYELRINGVPGIAGAAPARERDPACPAGRRALTHANPQRRSHRTTFARSRSSVHSCCSSRLSACFSIFDI